MKIRILVVLTGLAVLLSFAFLIANRYELKSKSERTDKTLGNRHQPESKARRTGKPNIVFLLADDIGYGDLACYGHPYAHTPTLDKLASEGTRFTRHYAAGANCSASRFGLMTGTFPPRCQVRPDRRGLNGHVSMTERLRANGYRTAHFGKWDIGPDTIPGTYGIDEIKINRGLENDDRGRDAGIFDNAIDFIERNKDHPFYVNVWGHISHFPVDAPHAFAAEFRNVELSSTDFSEYMQVKIAENSTLFGEWNPRMGEYLGELASLDRAVKRLLDKIDDLGLRQKTIIVFSSDHGPLGATSLTPRTRGELHQVIEQKAKARAKDHSEELRANMLGYNGALKGGKHNHYEGGYGSPFIIRWPNKVPAGKVNNSSVIAAVDLLPTLCSITGVEKRSQNLDGEDVSDVWLGSDRSRTNPIFWKARAKGALPSMLSHEWKYHASRESPHEAELYNLANDPGERLSVADKYPQVVQELRAKLTAWVESLPDETRGRR